MGQGKDVWKKEEYLESNILIYLEEKVYMQYIYVYIYLYKIMKIQINGFFH